jgi:hypothetical protein
MRFAATATAIGLTAWVSVAGSQQAPPARRAPAPRPAQGAADAAVPFKVGESLTYDVSWSSYLVAGSAITSVREKRASYGSTAYYIVAEGRPLPLLTRIYNLYYKMDSLVESTTLLSQRGSLYSEEGSGHQLGVTRFDRPGRRAFFELQAPDDTAKIDFAVPAQTQDGLAVLYALRARALKTGDRITTPVADGGSLYTITASVGALDKVRVPLGEFSAWRVDATIVDDQGQVIWKNIGLWISNDARRLPVKMQADLPVGQFLLALREASQNP